MRKLFVKLIRPLYMVYFKLIWRYNNRHNYTYAQNKFFYRNVSVGKATYGPIEVLYDMGTSRLSIGNYCSIAANVKFFLGGHHDYKRISLYPFQTFVYKGFNGCNRNTSMDIIVEDDVWIGYDCIILPGAHVGKGCVIGARSIVTGNIPPYSIYVGNKVIKKRFSDDIISIIKDIDFAAIRHCAGDSYEKFCATQITEDNVLIVKELFEN